MEIQLFKAKYPEVLHGCYINCNNCTSVLERLVWILMAYAKRHGVVPCRIHQVENGEIVLFGNPSPTELKWAKAAEKFIK